MRYNLYNTPCHQSTSLSRLYETTWRWPKMGRNM